MVQALPEHRQYRQGDSHRGIGLIDAHGQSEKKAGRKAPGPAALLRQPHGQHRQQDGQAVGGGGEHIEEGVPQAGKGGHEHAGQGGQSAAVQSQDQDGGGRRQGEEHHGQKADEGGHLRKAVEGGGVVEEPPAGHGHLLWVEHPAEAV